jgi:hypothetical protein
MNTVLSHGIRKFALMPMGDVETTMRLLAERVRPLLSAAVRESAAQKEA